MVVSTAQTFPTVWEALFIPHTLRITFKSSALMYKKPIRLPSSYMLILCSMHINCQLLDALLKNALKVLVWSRGRLVTLQILTSSSFSLVEETHGSSGQCVSYSLIDVGSGFTAYKAYYVRSFSFLFISFPRKKKKEKLRKHRKSSSHQLRRRGYLGRKAPSPEKKKAVSEDQEVCVQANQQTSPD